MISRRALSALSGDAGRTLLGRRQQAGARSVPGIVREYRSAGAWLRHVLPVILRSRGKWKTEGGRNRPQMRGRCGRCSASGGSIAHLTSRVLWRDEADGFSVTKVEFDLECGVPVRGCLGVPDGELKGLILLGHGMASTPEPVLR